MKTIRRNVITALVVVLGLAAVPVSSVAMDGKATGTLAGAGGHNASGTAAIVKDKNGNAVLTMTDVRVDRVPDGWVHLAKGGDYTKGVKLGKMTTFSGTVDYPIPGGVNPQEYDSVVIGCHKFDVEIGRALFEKAMMK